MDWSRPADDRGRHGWPLAVACACALAILSSAALAWPDAANGTVNIDFSHDRIQPTPAQTAAIRHAAASDIQDFIHPESGGYSVAQADLNGDGRPDLLVQFNDISFCGSSGCSGVIVMATAKGYAATALDLPNFGGRLAVLPTRHHGMHDLQYDGDSPVWKWNGKDYDVDPADLPGAHAPAWQTRNAGDRMVATVVPIDSVIQSVSVFCNAGKPWLAMVVNARPPAGPVTLTLVFRGWGVNAPMQQGNRDATMWLADLSGSDLPQWLAHRGTSATTSELARLADRSYLRINSVMQGEMSLKDSTAATQAALGACYHY